VIANKQSRHPERKVIANKQSRHLERDKENHRTKYVLGQDKKSTNKKARKYMQKGGIAEFAIKVQTRHSTEQSRSF
jgi:hypothetical protein